MLSLIILAEILNLFLSLYELPHLALNLLLLEKYLNSTQKKMVRSRKKKTQHGDDKKMFRFISNNHPFQIHVRSTDLHFSFVEMRAEWSCEKQQHRGNNNLTKTWEKKLFFREETFLLLDVGTTPPLLVIIHFFLYKRKKLMVASFFGHKNIY